MTTHGHHDPAATSAQPEDAQRPSPPGGTGRPAQAEGAGLRPHPSAAGGLPTPPKAGTGVVLVAAGSGTRLGRGMPKALVSLAGRPLLSHALDGVAAAGIAGRIVVVLPPGDTELRAVCREAARRAGAGGPEILAVDGGATRNDSVRAGLDALGECRLVLVHDAARCLAPPEVFAAVAAALQAGAAAVIPAVPVVDTVKEVAASGRPGIAPETVASTPARSALRAVQTPQGFRTADLLDAHRAAAGWEAARAELVTDDAMLMELAGAEVFVVPGSPQALKITTPVDLLLAEALLANGYGPAPEDAP